MSLMWIPAQTTIAALAHVAECVRDELAGGGEEDRGVELDRRPVRGVSGPGRAERSRECLGRASSPGRVSA